MIDGPHEHIKAIGIVNSFSRVLQDFRAGPAHDEKLEKLFVRICFFIVVPARVHVEIVRKFVIIVIHYRVESLCKCGVIQIAVSNPVIANFVTSKIFSC